MRQDKKIRILMLSAGMITGSFRMMMDIIERIDPVRFDVYVTYKPDYSEWTSLEIQSILKTGAKIVPLKGKRLFDLRGLIEIWNTLIKERIDILHSWDVLGIPSRVIAKVSGSRIAEEIVNPPPVIRKHISRKHYLINKTTSIFVDGYAACSKNIMDRYIFERHMFFKNKLVSVIPNCIDVPPLSPNKYNVNSFRKNYHITENEFILTNIGHFNDQKAQADLIYSFNQVVYEKPDTRLFLIGWGPLEKELKRLTKQFDLEDKVIFTGKLDRQQIFRVLAFTDLFILSSHWEGFGIVLIEAMAMAKAVISTNTDGAREVISDDETGVLVPVGNVQTMAEAILDLIERPEKRQALGQSGRSSVIQNYHCGQYINRYESFYHRLLSSN